MKWFFDFILLLGAASAFNLPAVQFNSSRALLTDVKSEGRVYKGENAVLYQFPYQVGIRIYTHNTKKKFCGGSLIDKKWVLTAAHCVFDADIVYIYLGAVVSDQAEHIVPVLKHRITVHSSYSPGVNAFDIALIKVRRVHLSASINIVRLPDIAYSYNSYENQLAVISGWGDPNNKKDLKYGILTVINNELCKAFYGDAISGNRICAMSNSDVSMCMGDSGGPLVLLNDGTLIGVASQMATVDCTLGPSVYTRVTAYLPWIKAITNISY